MQKKTQEQQSQKQEQQSQKQEEVKLWVSKWVPEEPQERGEKPWIEYEYDRLDEELRKQAQKQKQQEEKWLNEWMNNNYTAWMDELKNHPEQEWDNWIQKMWNNKWEKKWQQEKKQRQEQQQLDELFAEVAKYEEEEKNLSLDERLRRLRRTWEQQPQELK